MKLETAGRVALVTGGSGAIGARLHHTPGARVIAVCLPSGPHEHSVSKAGAHGFTMALACEVARKGVTVNIVAPGYIASPMIEAVLEAARAKILEGIPAGRYSAPDNIVATVTFLCLEQVACVTDAQLPANGGLYRSA